jgi:hypothetical protein
MSDLREPNYCPICGSDSIETNYDNHANGNFVEWYYYECEECESTGEVH